MTPAPVGRRRFVAGMAAVGLAGFIGVPARRRHHPTFDVRDFGAHGNGKTDDTKAIQRAIHAASKERGTVRLSKGRYLSGGLLLASGVTFAIETDATLLGSRDITDYRPREHLSYPTYSDFETSDFHNALLSGERLHDIAILGEGTIDANFDHRYGPKPIALRRCHDVEVRGITIRNAPNYCVSLGGCDDVLVEDVTIRDAFADGIDPDCCRRVRIRNCDIESDDDAVVLKTSLILGTRRPTEDVHVVGCRLNSPSNGFKIGTETSGDVRRVRVERCHISGTPRKGADPLGLTTKGESGGVAIESVDGAVVEDVRITNCTVDADVPIFVRLGARGRGQTAGVKPGAIRDVTIAGLRAIAHEACTVSGVPGYRVERLTLQNVAVTMVGGGHAPPGAVPELEAEYPQAGMFGGLPALGVYVRHAAGVALRNVQVKLVTLQGDPRPGLFADDVTGLVVDPPLGFPGEPS